MEMVSWLRDNQSFYFSGIGIALLALGYASYEDFKTLKVGNQCLLVYILGNILAAIAGQETVGSVLGGLLLGLLMIGISRQSEGRLGEGDAWIMAGGGIALGFTDSLLVIYSALTISFLVGFLRKKGKSIKKVRIPFIPIYFCCYLTQVLKTNF